VNHAVRAATRASITEQAFRGPEKKNPAVGTPGQIFLLSEFTVSSMRPGCLLAMPEGAEQMLLLSSRFLFLFFYFLLLL
jgi:hypothetical protein